MNKEKHALLLLLAVTVALLSAGCPTDIVFIRDKGLDTAFRHALSQPFGMLTKTDLARIHSLDARSLGIRDLSGIEHCRNLQWLDLDTNKVSDLTPLGQLGNPEDPFSSPLVYMNLDNNEITDIAPLAGLLNLQGLSLFYNQIADITPLVTNAMNGGLGSGDYVIIDFDTLGEEAQNVDVPTLESLGVRIYGVVPADSAK